MTRIQVLVVVLLVVGATAGATVATSANQAQSVSDAAVTSGGVFWQGQLLGFSAGAANASEVWSIRRVEDGTVGLLATEVLLDATGSAVFATEGLDGQYVVVNEAGEPVVFENGVAQRVGSVSEASFEITTQTLNVTFEDEVVRNGQSPDARTNLRLRSNRAGYRPTLFSDQLNATELAGIFPSVEVRDGRAVATRNASTDEIFDANFTGVEPGTYDVTVATTEGTADETVSITVTEPVVGTAAISQKIVTEQRGDVARFDVTFEESDEATVTIGSAEVGYRTSFTVVDADGDGVATVTFDTYLAGRPGASGISAVGEDRITDYRLETDPISRRLDAAAYPVVVSVGGTRYDVASIALEEPSVEGVESWTAPDRASVGGTRVPEVGTPDDDVAYQDWAIVRVQASGLYSYVEDLSDLDDPATGLSFSLTDLGGMNVPPSEVSLDRARLVVDETDDQLFVVVDSNALERGATYRANFTVTPANSYVSTRQSFVTNFTVVERTSAFDGPVEVPATSEATISGTTSVAPGTELTVEAVDFETSPFLKRQTVTVGDDGAWQATFDFSDVPAGTEFAVSVVEPQADATGVVVSADGAGNETTAGNETAGNETTRANGTDATTEATTEETTETTAEETTETTTEETTEATTEEATTATDSERTLTGETLEETTPATITTTETPVATAPATGFGMASLALALAVLLAGGLVAVRRS